MSTSSSKCSARRRKRVAHALGIGGIALTAGGSAVAQDIRINVTGTNIKRVDTETAAPIETITREDIQASGLQTISDVLRQITANNNGSISPSFINGFSASGSAVSLRGLGPNNTLVLLNGRRLANFGLADDAHISYVDLQQIPFDAVERIEVLKDGASAIYGSDAVAGVVNIILRQQFTGVTVTGTAGTTYNGEGNQYKGAVTFGFGDLTKARYNVFVTIDGQKQEASPMNKGRRYIGTNDLRFMGLPDVRRSSPLSGFGAGSLLGNVQPIDTTDPNATQPLPGACAPASQDGPFCRWETKDFVDLSPRVDPFNAFARGTYDFADSMQGYAELSWFQVKTETRREISPDLTSKVVSENTIFDAKASRDLYKLAGGQLALAVGYEFRKEELSNPGTPGTETGNVLGLGYSAAFGNRSVNAAFAELYAPVRKDLEITAAVRYDDYPDVGGTINPKIGVKWSVLPQLVLRGTYETAFRAPGLYETSTANVSSGFVPIVDPVRCPVTGSPEDCQAFILGINTGNPLIKPETSTTYTVGLIFEPIPGLSGTLDYWNIVTKNQVAGGDAQAVVNDPSAFPTGSLRRDTNNLSGIPNSGTLLYVSTESQNANNVRTDGIDLDIVWRQSLEGWGMLRTEFQWTHVFNYKQTSSDGQTFSYAGTQGNYLVSSGAGTPADRMNLIIGWNRGPWNVTGTVRYVSDYPSIAWQVSPKCLSPFLNTPPDCHVSSFTTLDLSAQYTGFKNWQIFGSIINVFNRIAPFNPAAAYGGVNFNYNYAFSGGTGMQLNRGARYTFQ